MATLVFYYLVIWSASMLIILKVLNVDIESWKSGNDFDKEI
jgi:hypothetical protein